MATGPEHYREAERLAALAHHYTYGDGADPGTGAALAAEAQVHATLAQEISDGPAADLISAATDDVLRGWAARIRETGAAKGWSTWAAEFIDPDSDFVDTGMPSTETLLDELRRQDRQAVLREVDERLATISLPDYLKGTLNAGSYGREPARTWQLIDGRLRQVMASVPGEQHVLAQPWQDYADAVRRCRALVQDMLDTDPERRAAALKAKVYRVLDEASRTQTLPALKLAQVRMHLADLITDGLLPREKDTRGGGRPSAGESTPGPTGDGA